MRTASVLSLILIIGCGSSSPTVDTRSEKNDLIIMETDHNIVLNKVLADLLTSPIHEEIRRDYLQQGDKRFVLVNDKEFACLWPSDFKPDIPDYTYRIYDTIRDSPPGKGFPLLGIRLDKLDLNDVKIDPFYGNVSISIFNIGGGKENDKTPMEATSFYYIAKRKSTGWSVEFVSLRNP